MFDINTSSDMITSDSERISLKAVQNTKFDLGNNGSIEDRIKKTYHDQRIGQSKWAFRLSIWGGMLGFFIIVCSLWRGGQNGNYQWIGVTSGGIIEAVSALFYTLSTRANEKISEFFSELTKDANVHAALDLADKIEDSKIRDELRVKLALYLAGIEEDKICKNTNEICSKEYK